MGPDLDGHPVPTVIAIVVHSGMEWHTPKGSVRCLLCATMVARTRASTCASYCRDSGQPIFTLHALCPAVHCSPAGLMLYDGEYFEDLKHGHGG